MASDPLPDLPPSFRKDLSQVNASLYTAVSCWLRKHGKVREGVVGGGKGSDNFSLHAMATWSMPSLGAVLPGH